MKPKYNVKIFKLFLCCFIINTINSCASFNHDVYEFIIVDYINTLNIEVINDFPVTLSIILPSDYENRQRILDEEFSILPDRIIEDENARYAIYSFNKKGIYEVRIKTCLELIRYDYTVASKIRFINDYDNINGYLYFEPFIDEIDGGNYEKTAFELVGKNRLETVTNIFNYIQNNMVYDNSLDNSKGSSRAFYAEAGKCSDFADLMIAFCRINNIPARYCEGFYLYGHPYDHAWVEVFFESLGWVPFDPTIAQTDYETTLNNLLNGYIYLSFVRNDSNLKGYHYYCYEYNVGNKPIIDYSVDFCVIEYQEL